MPLHSLLSTAILAALLSPFAATAAESAADGTASDVQQPDAVSAIGQGETRQVQRITRQDTAVLPPGTSTPFQAAIAHIVLSPSAGRLPCLGGQMPDDRPDLLRFTPPAVSPPPPTIPEDFGSGLH